MAKWRINIEPQDSVASPQEGGVIWGWEVREMPSYNLAGRVMASGVALTPEIAEEQAKDWARALNQAKTIIFDPDGEGDGVRKPLSG